MLKRFRGCDSFVRVLDEQLLDEILGCGGDVLPLAITEVVLTLHILVQNFIRTVAFKERSTGKNDVKDDADAENVCLAIVSLFLQQLGRYVAWTATPEKKLLRVVVDHGCQAEVSDFQVPIVLLRREEQVLGLQISVHDVLRVQVLQRTDEVFHHRSRV